METNAMRLCKIWFLKTKSAHHHHWIDSVTVDSVAVQFPGSMPSWNLFSE